MKISLITACYNSAGTIRTAIESVLSQKGVDIEYIVVDGGSFDETVDIIKEYSTRSTCSTRLTFKWISEKDHGMYDAINKGIKMATGDVVGILNADDVLYSDETLAHIAGTFSRVEHVERVDCVHADIRFVKRRDAPRIEPPSALASLGGYASPSQGGESLSRDAHGRDVHCRMAVEHRDQPRRPPRTARQWRLVVLAIDLPQVPFQDMWFCVQKTVK